LLAGALRIIHHEPAAVDEHQPTDTLRRTGCSLENHAAPHAVSDQNGLLDRQRLEQLGNVLAVRVDVETRLEPGGAVATQITSEHPMTRREGCDLGRPVGELAAQSVNQHHGDGRFVGPFDDIVQRSIGPVECRHRLNPVERFRRIMQMLRMQKCTV
jgi:hypothetical protein